MLERDWNQSDLARAAWGTTQNSQGYTVAKNRETVSQLLHGKVQPTPLTVSKLAKAFGMDPEVLYPNAKMLAIKQEKEPEFEFKVAPGHSDEGWLKVNRLVSYDQFARIVAILNENKLDGRKK